MGIFDKDKLNQFGKNVVNGLGKVWDAYQSAQQTQQKQSGGGLQPALGNQAQAADKPVWNDPGESGDMKAVYDKIMGREAFQYDLNGDALYQQLRQTYQKQGQLGAMNAVGNAAALSGGYGNSYAAAAGQQAYQQSLEGLNEHIPDLYAMALQQYQMEGDQMLQQYQVASNDRAFQYNKYRDDMADWTDNRNFEYQKGRDAVADSQWAAEFGENKRQFDANLGFQMARAAAQDAQWEKQFDYNQFLDNRNFEYQQGRDAEDDRRWQANYDRNVYESDRDYDFQLGRASRADYESDRDYSRGVYEWDKQFNYNASRDAEADRQWQESFDYNKQRDAVADQQWLREFRLDKHHTLWGEKMDEKNFKFTQEKDARDYNYQEKRDTIGDQQWQTQFNYNKQADQNDLKYKYAALGLRYG